MTWKSRFSRTVLGAVLLLLLFSTVTVSAQFSRSRKVGGGASVSSRQTYRNSLASDEFGIHNLINRERSKKGLGELVWDDRLAQMARLYSRKMAKESFFSHFDRNGNSVVERADDSEIKGWTKIGENLFFCEGYDSFTALAVRGWMGSPSHRENILDRRFNTTGIGIAESRDGEIYITQVFLQRQR